jgi:hypothetical protein
MVQFPHYSVKEFLTSDRLAASTGSVARPSYSPRARTYYFDQMRQRVTSFEKNHYQRTASSITTRVQLR